MKKRLPDFKREDEERRFWATADSTEYIDWPLGERKKLVQLKPTLRTISLLKIFLAKRLALERKS